MEINAAFSRLLTPDLAFQADATWINRAGAGDSNATGFDTTQVGLRGCSSLQLADQEDGRVAGRGNVAGGDYHDGQAPFFISLQ
jgi:hypothetical protein